MLAFLSWTGNPGTVTAPPGWTLVKGNTQPAQGPAAAIYQAIAGASEPTTYTFAWTNAVGGGGATASYSQVSGTTPVSASVAGSPVLGSKTATIPSVTTTGPYQRVIGFSAVNVAAGFGAAPAGWTVRTSSFGSNPNGGVVDRQVTNAGASGTAGWTNNTGGSPNVVDSLSIAVALQP